jgi:hypothetical protein
MDGKKVFIVRVFDYDTVFYLGRDDPVTKGCLRYLVTPTFASGVSSVRRCYNTHKYFSRV